MQLNFIEMIWNQTLQLKRLPHIQNFTKRRKVYTELHVNWINAALSLGAINPSSYPDMFGACRLVVKPQLWAVADTNLFYHKDSDKAWITLPIFTPGAKGTLWGLTPVRATKTEPGLGPKDFMKHIW